jgi:hypothetical protein
VGAAGRFYIERDEFYVTSGTEDTGEGGRWV